MKKTFSAVLLLFVIASCNQGRSVTGISDDLKSAVDFQVATLGKAPDQYREMDLYDYEVSIKNNWKYSIFLACSAPKFLSGYLVKRNPKAINYSTTGLSGAKNLSNRGLMGTGGVVELKQGENISFIAPLPVIPNHDQPGEFKISLTLYLNAELKPGVPMKSLPLKFNPND